MIHLTLILLILWNMLLTALVWYILDTQKEQLGREIKSKELELRMITRAKS
jgi:hypothetical protein